MRRPALLPLLAVAGLLAPLPVQAQQPVPAAPAEQAAVPRVGVRSGVHPTYTRLVFDWPRQTPYSLSQTGNQVTIRFPVAAAADLAAVLRARPPRITGLDQERADGALIVRFTIPEGAGVKDMRAGNRIVFDVLDKAPPAPVPTNATPAKPTPAPTEKPPVPAAVPPNDPASARRAQEGAPLFELRSKQTAPGAATTTAQTPPPAPGVVPPAATAPPTSIAPPVTRPATPAPSPAAPAATPVTNGSNPVTPAAQVMSVPFDPKQGTAAAIFERAGWIYVLFDREVPPDTAPAPAAVPWLASAIEPVPVPDASGFRFPMSALMEASVRRDGTVWHVELRRADETAAAAGPALLAKPDMDFALGPRLVVAAPEAGTVLSFRDPVVGDTLAVVPLSQPGPHVDAGQRFAQAQLLPTLQGLVVRPLDDKVQVQPVREGVEISAPGGLVLSPAADVAAATPPPPPPAAGPVRLFDFKRWGQVPSARYVAARQDKWQALAAQPEAERNRGRLDIARFYAANGLGYEANGMLTRVQAEQPDVDRRPEFLAARGIARVMIGDHAGAIADLTSKGVAGEPDADLWRAAALAGQQDFAGAHALFQARKALLASYPEPFFTQLSLSAADAALREGHPDIAGELLEQVVKRGGDQGQSGPAVAYYRGKVQQALGDNEKALPLFEQAMNSRDRLYAMRGKRDFLDTSLALGRIDAKEAAKRMEEMRFAWIGDALELSNLRRIGQVHALAGDYPKAFDTMRHTISLYPDTPEAKEIAAEMTKTFTDLFGSDGAASMPALDALALYEQYRELTPPGADGDRVIQKLAERMVEIDLLDRAGALLDHQVQYRLSGPDKARVGTRLAGIRLLDGKPTEALAALDSSQIDTMPPELVEERRLLRARALSQSGQGAAAITLLADDQSRNANMMRVDIAMRDKQWAAAAAALADLIGPPPPPNAELDPKQSSLIVNRAVALSLAQDNAGLDALRRDYGAAMEKSRDATAFRVLTRPEEAAGLADAATIRSRITEIDLFRSFLDSYRTKQEPAAATAAAPPPAPS